MIHRMTPHRLLRNPFRRSLTGAALPPTGLSQSRDRKGAVGPARRSDYVATGLFLCMLFGFFISPTYPRPSCNRALLEWMRPDQAFSVVDFPLSFEQNVGHSDPRYPFLARGAGYTLFLSGASAVLDLRDDKERSVGLVQFSLVGGTDGSARLEPVGPMTGRVNYFIGNQRERWLTDIPTYGKLRVGSPYPGIDLIYYGRQTELEHDIVVSPGADPDSIRFAFQGVNAMSVDGAGALILAVGSHKVRWRKPEIYQEVQGARRIIPGAYRIHGARQVGFAIGDYDRSRPLVIDPVINYATYLGRQGNETASHLAMDSAGNVYLTGWTSSQEYPATPGAVMPPARVGTGKAIITKVPASGTGLTYSTYIGGVGDDSGLAIAVDGAGNVYIAGTTISQDFPVTATALQKQFGGGARAIPVMMGDCFVAKLNPAGNALLYATYLGGNQPDACRGIAADASGNAYVTGLTGSTNFPVTEGAFRQTYRGGAGQEWVQSADAFVAKINPAGTALVYSTYFGGAGDDWGLGIAVDSSGSAYVTGFTTSSSLPVTPGAFQTAYRGSGGQPNALTGDAFVLKMNPQGTGATYSTYLGGGLDDIGLAIAVDSNGNTYVAGSTLSPNFPLSQQAFQMIYGGAGGEDNTAAGDAFVVKLNPAGNGLLYSTFLGGRQDDRATAIAIDAAGNAYVTGHTLSPNFPTLGEGRQSSNRGTGTGSFVRTGDAFLTQLNSSGQALIYSTYLGGTSDEFGAGVAVDRAGNIWVAGNTASGDFPATAGTPQRSYGGGTAAGAGVFPFGDAFLVRFGDAPPPPPAPTAQISAVANAGGFSAGAPGVAPGSIATLFGALMASSTASAASTPLPTTLGGATVTVNGRAAPLFYASPTQINLQIPYETAVGQASVVVTVDGVAGQPAQVTIARASPGIFVYGTNRAVVHNQDFSVNAADNPAKVGSAIIVYLTGGGPMDNPVPTGVPGPSSPLSRVTAEASATIGGRTAQILFLGHTPGLVGVVQANLQVPEAPAGDHPLILTIAGNRSNGPLITVGGN